MQYWHSYTTMVNSLPGADHARFSPQVSQLELESTQLRESLISKNAMVKSLERRVNTLEAEVGLPPHSI